MQLYIIISLISMYKFSQKTVYVWSVQNFNT